MNRWDSRALHEELAVIYRRYPGMSVATSQTEALWKRILEAEAREVATGESQKRG